ncbi:TetR/AcrR family transcriptional regulator [Spirosoma montaniterrae]|nr:TetR/AcrR family transcriptional regulator [Spirosoma montaniterrae]
MKKAPSDRRIDRTRKLLTDALIELVLEKGYEAVTVQDIIDRANVGRSTFYAHFENKEQLLFSGRGWLTEDLFDESGTSADQLTLGVNLSALFRHVVDNHRLAKAMLGKSSGELVINHIRESLTMQMRKALKVQVGGIAEVNANLTAQALASMLIGLLRSWLEQDMPISAQEVTDLAERLIKSSLAG